MRKGVLVAGGEGTRLAPLTKVFSKHLLPVYNQPMIVYPLQTLVQAGVKDILLVTHQPELEQYRIFLDDGAQWGVRLNYLEHPRRKGVAHALLATQDFIENDPCVAILGDNFFYGAELAEHFRALKDFNSGCHIFLKQVPNPSDYGVVACNARGDIFDVVEKPVEPPSRNAITGLYYFDSQLAHFARELKPSARGELEITDILVRYLEQQQLSATYLSEASTWFDMGQFDTLLAAAEFSRRINYEMERN